ncbi:ATPase associated with various cellular activities AAA_5 [Actinobacteria bacterium OK006]|nr:ATPase associated with various cellular activities AAA_5 [Actinobacteria bacterium OK006]
MNWTPYYRGGGQLPDVLPELSAPPPWRSGRNRSNGDRAEATNTFASTYRPSPGLVDAVNAALHLRRPLLLTGAAGSGKSSLIEQVAFEMGLGTVLRWHITSRSTLGEALYRYDALGRIHARTLRDAELPREARRALRKVRRGDAAGPRDDIGDFVQLGPLGTALLPAERPRALLIDEVDKADLDLPSDLLDVLERGRFEIPELARHARPQVRVRTALPGETYTVEHGLVESTEFPFIVLTSNGERDFPPPFLRRCVRFDMPPLDRTMLSEIIAAHLGAVDDPDTDDLLTGFAEGIRNGEHLAVDQLLNAVFLLRGATVHETEQRERLRKLLLRELGRG